MQIKETIEVSFPGAVEGPPLEDVLAGQRRRRAWSTAHIQRESAEPPR
jgi:hypothetical protein